MKITVFLPCRKGSQRIPSKNIKTFAGVEGGLLRIKLKQLSDLKSITNIILSTNDEEVIKIASEIEIENLIIDRRRDELCLSSTSTDDLIKYIPEIIPSGHVLWTHVTSPFINEKRYAEIIEEYKISLLQEYDSLMTVLPLQGFIWDSNKPISYNRNIEKWPRTQTIASMFEIDSGVFLNSVDNYLKLNDRIGLHPKMFTTSKIESFDIDWPEDFEIAEIIYKIRLGKNGSVCK